MKLMALRVPHCGAGPEKSRSRGPHEPPVGPSSPASLGRPARGDLPASPHLQRGIGAQECPQEDHSPNNSTNPRPIRAQPDSLESPRGPQRGAHCAREWRGPPRPAISSARSLWTPFRPGPSHPPVRPPATGSAWPPDALAPSPPSTRTSRARCAPPQAPRTRFPWVPFHPLAEKGGARVGLNKKNPARDPRGRSSRPSGAHSSRGGRPWPPSLVALPPILAEQCPPQSSQGRRQGPEGGEWPPWPGARASESPQTQPPAPPGNPPARPRVPP
jgi:hypothetical protein